MSQYRAILDVFHQDLDRATELLELTIRFRAFAGSIPESRPLADVGQWVEVGYLADIAPQVRTDLPVLSGSILLYLCGRFENFVRELVMAVGDDHAAHASSYEDLPEVIRRELYVKTLEVAKAPSKFNFEQSAAEQLVVTLADSLKSPAGSSVSIDTKLLAITDANMHSRMLAEICKRIGIDSVWREIGRQAPLKSYLGLADDSQCTNKVTSDLDEIMKVRNGIAHPTSSTTFPDPDKVKNYVEFFRVLSRVLCDVASVPRR